MDTVFIRGLEVSAIIGAHSWERQVKQALAFDVDIAADVRKAASTDNLADAVDYSAVAARIKQYVEGSDFQLIETVAERVADLLATEFGIDWVRLTVIKPRPLSGRHLVGVTIERGRRDGGERSEARRHP